MKSGPAHRPGAGIKIENPNIWPVGGLPPLANQITPNSDFDFLELSWNLELEPRPRTRRASSGLAPLTHVLILGVQHAKEGGHQSPRRKAVVRRLRDACTMMWGVCLFVIMRRKRIIKGDWMGDAARTAARPQCKGRPRVDMPNNTRDYVFFFLQTAVVNVGASARQQNVVMCRREKLLSKAPWRDA